MKKCITMILTLALLLGLCACGNDANPESTGASVAATGLTVGYGRELIMPKEPVMLGGYGDSSRISTGFLDYLYCTCIAMSYEDETVLLFTQDLVRSYEPWVEKARVLITAATGIPADRIMICSTHTHSAPETNSNNAATMAYLELYLEAMVTAAEGALADRAPTTLHGAKTNLENMNFIRHYLLSDGSYAGSNFGDFNAGAIVDHAGDPDNEMQLVKFDREGDKKDILLVNWQAHPDHSKSLGFTSLSADFIGPLRTKLEKETGMEVAYFTGDTGDINPFSKMSDNHGLDWKKYGEKLADYAMELLPSLTPITGTGIQAKQVMFEYAQNHSNEDKLSEAQQVVALGNTAAGNALAKELGLGTYSEASNVLQRVKRPETDTLELNAFNIAGMSFITAPYEMFAASGMYIKENSPFDITLIFGNANDWNSYCATEAAYDYISYESSAGFFARGCAEACADQFVEMLKSIK